MNKNHNFDKHLDEAEYTFYELVSGKYRGRILSNVLLDNWDAAVKHSESLVGEWGGALISFGLSSEIEEPPTFPNYVDPEVKDLNAPPKDTFVAGNAHLIRKYVTSRNPPEWIDKYLKHRHQTTAGKIAPCDLVGSKLILELMLSAQKNCLSDEAHVHRNARLIELAQELHKRLRKH